VMSKGLQTIDAFGIKILTPESYNVVFGWVVGSGFCPSDWAADGRGVTVTTGWEQVIDGAKMPDVSKAAKIGAAIGAAALSVIPGGAAIVAAAMPVVAIGLTALDALQNTADGMLGADAMYFPPNWWRASWPLQVLQAGRWLLISGQIPETTDEPQPAVCCLDGSTRLEELSGPSAPWAIWLAAPDAWCTWAHDRAAAVLQRASTPVPPPPPRPAGGPKVNIRQFQGFGK